MKLQELLDQYPRIQIAKPSNQDAIFEIIDQTSISSEALQVSFERKPDFYHFLKAQGDRAFVYHFLNKDGSVKGFGASTFRQMEWNGQPVCIGYTSDLRTTAQLDRDARLQWRKFYGHAVEMSDQIEEYAGCIGYITAVWNENKLAQKALVKKKRPGDVSYDAVNTYHSLSMWGRWKPLSKPTTLVRSINKSEIPLLLDLLCHQDKLSWNQQDLSRTLKVFGKTFDDFHVLEKNGRPEAFVLSVAPSKAKKTIIKKWPAYLGFMARLLPLFGKRRIKLNEPIEILQLILFKSINGQETENLLSFIDHFWYQNSLKAKSEKFSVLAINVWDRIDRKPLGLNREGYLFTSIEGTLYKVTTDKTSPLFQQMNDFSHLEVGFL